MNTWLWSLGQDTITVAVLLPFVALACRLVRNRPAVQHALWVVVLLKFLTPPIVSWPWTVEQIREALGTTPASVSAEELSATLLVVPKTANDLPQSSGADEQSPTPKPGKTDSAPKSVPAPASRHQWPRFSAGTRFGVPLS